MDVVAASRALHQNRARILCHGKLEISDVGTAVLYFFFCRTFHVNPAFWAFCSRVLLFSTSTGNAL